MSDRVPIASSSTPGLGRSFWAAQLAQLVSLIADACLLWAALWWLLRGPSPSRDDAEAMVGAVLGVWPLALVTFAPLADRWPRKQSLLYSCLGRAGLHLVTAALLVRGGLSPSIAVLLLGANAALTGLYDGAAVAVVPSLVGEARTARALGYSLILPRAAFFVTSMFAIILLAMFDAAWTCAGAAGWLLIAAFLLWRLDERRPEPARPARGYLVELWQGCRATVLQPRARQALVLAAAAGFAVHPLYWASPAAASDGAPLVSENQELILCAGVLLGAALGGRLSRALGERALVGLSLAVLGAGISGLGLAPGQVWPYFASFCVGFGLIGAVGWATATAVLGSPDAMRGRVAALTTAGYVLGGELGGATWLPDAGGTASVLPVLALPYLGAALAVTWWPDR